MPRGGAYADCAEQWSPGILGSSPPRNGWWKRGRIGRWCRRCVWRHLAVGMRRPLGLGCGVSTPRRGTTDAQCSPRAKKVVVHTHRTTRHRERAPHELRARNHGALCLAREGTACTKVVLQSRVLFRDVVVVGVLLFALVDFRKVGRLRAC